MAREVWNVACRRCARAMPVDSSDCMTCGVCRVTLCRDCFPPHVCSDKDLEAVREANRKQVESDRRFDGLYRVGGKT